jgi:hypothetical protein
MTHIFLAVQTNSHYLKHVKDGLMRKMNSVCAAGSFTGATNPKQPAIDGFYNTPSGTAVPVGLKELSSSNPTRIVNEVASTVRVGSKEGITDATVLIDAPAMNMASVRQFAENGPLTKGMLNEGVVNQVVVRTSDGILTITNGKVTLGYL